MDPDLERLAREVEIALGGLGHYMLRPAGDLNKGKHFIACLQGRGPDIYDTGYWSTTQSDGTWRPPCPECQAWLKKHKHPYDGLPG